jgi:hypothetical protein
MNACLLQISSIKFFFILIYFNFSKFTFKNKIHKNVNTNCQISFSLLFHGTMKAAIIAERVGRKRDIPAKLHHKTHNTPVSINTCSNGEKKQV